MLLGTVGGGSAVVEEEARNAVIVSGIKSSLKRRDAEVANVIANELDVNAVVE